MINSTRYLSEDTNIVRLILYLQVRHTREWSVEHSTDPQLYDSN
jgi:hypothetical protein